MKNKVVNLFDNNNTPQNPNYSALLREFIKHFEKEFPNDFNLEDMIYFGQNAWNFANLRTILSPKEYERIISQVFTDKEDKDLLVRMVNWKEKEFKDHRMYIDNLEIREVEGNPEVEVSVVDEEVFLTQILTEGDEDFFDDEDIDAESDYDEGYIDRFAIVIKANKPFHDWVKKVDPDFYMEEDFMTTIYLVNETFTDLKVWLKDNFDDFFRMELEKEIVEEEKWPQNRTYRMFKQWFDVQISTMIYDLEEFPISKQN